MPIATTTSHQQAQSLPWGPATVLGAACPPHCSSTEQPGSPRPFKVTQSQEAQLEQAPRLPDSLPDCLGEGVPRADRHTPALPATCPGAVPTGCPCSVALASQWNQRRASCPDHRVPKNRRQLPGPAKIYRLFTFQQLLLWVINVT